MNWAYILAGVIVFALNVVMILAVYSDYKREARIMKEILKHEYKLYTNQFK
jgi:hypothetical protein